MFFKSVPFGILSVSSAAFIHLFLIFLSILFGPYLCANYFIFYLFLHRVRATVIHWNLVEYRFQRCSSSIYYVDESSNKCRP